MIHIYIYIIIYIIITNHTAYKPLWRNHDHHSFRPPSARVSRRRGYTYLDHGQPVLGPQFHGGILQLPCLISEG